MKRYNIQTVHDHYGRVLFMKGNSYNKYIQSGIKKYEKNIQCYTYNILYTIN